MAKKPNILFVLTDDQRYNTINALGNKAIKTPNLDKLVENGTAFTNAHIPGGTSGAICMPSRAMLNTGRTLFHLEGEGQSIPSEHVLLGEVLKEQGYYNFGTGKWHNGPPAFARSFHCGDHAFFGGMWDHWNVPTNYYDPTGEYDNVINFVSNFFLSNEITKINCDKFNPGVHSTELLTDSVVQHIEQAPTDRPMFIYTAYLAPHDPRTMPEKYKNMYDPSEIELPENYMQEHPFDYGVTGIRDERLAANPRVDSEIKQHIAEYYGMITHLDDELGRILDALKQKGELDNTLIVFTGDNGLAVGCHGLMGKQNHYEHSIRIPLIFCGPGIDKGKKIDNYVYLLDIFPTLCDLIGCEIPSTVEGKSFAKMFSDSNFVTRDDLFFVYNDLLRSVKNDRYKLIEYRNTITKTQLFDLENDPAEINNLYGIEEYDEITQELRETLQRYRVEWDDESHQYGRSFWSNY